MPETVDRIGFEHESLFDKLADNEGHSVVVIAREEMQPTYLDLCKMHPTSRMPPEQARGVTRDFIVKGQNICTARPIVAREAQIIAAESDIRVELIDHGREGGARLVQIGEDGQLSRPLREGFYDVETDQMVSLYH